jgi:hypothetical protein
MNTSACFGVRFSLGLLVAGAAVGCIDRPKDETVIASRSTPVDFHGLTTSELGTADDADTAAHAFYLFAWDPVARRWMALTAAVYPTRNPVKYGNYDWHGLDFGERVIPTWAWDSEPTRWHAELRIADSSSWLAWFLYSFTSPELDCYIPAINAGGDKIGAAYKCGGDSIIDLYVNK